MPTPPTIQSIVEKAKAYLPNLCEERFIHAFEFADKAHRGQTRFSGEPYINHPLHVTDILLDFHPDEDTLVTALLHDVAEDTDRTLDDIEKEFGKKIRDLCDGLVKLSKVHSRLDDPQMENLRKLFLAMAKDFRVVLLKLCDRLHNMRTLEFVRPEKRQRISQETLNIYAPIAARLGIYRLKSQLEDLCFQYLHPEDFKSICDQLTKTAKWRQKYIEVAKRILTETLASEGIQATVDGRVKSAYSIFRKLAKKNKNSLDEIFDVFAMRIVLPDIYKYGREYSGHLYTALGIVHNHFTPLANRFKDYVAVPKVNGYRSLHTTVMGLGPKIHTQPTEVQLRTDGMHQSAEFGIAAHWLYEEEVEMVAFPSDKNTMPPFTFEAAAAASIAPFLKQQKDWISNLQKIEGEISSNQELLENLQVDIFRDRIFVLTPRGDVKDLPAGATPIDFAYEVHTEIGNHCIGAKVNGNQVSLDHELHSGEVVSIVTRKNARPSQHWLTFVKTNHARNRIRAWFRDLDDDRHLRSGKTLFNEKLEQLGRSSLDNDLSLLRHYDGKRLTFREREELLKEIGKGSLLPGTVIRKIWSLEELLGKKPEVKNEKLEARNQRSLAAKTPKLIIGEQMNTPYQFVQCCNAMFSDELVGYVTRGKGVSIHRKDCPVVRNMDTNRFIKVRVMGRAAEYPVQVRINAEDRLGLVRDISHVIADNKINILDLFQLPPKNGHAELNFILEILDFDQLELVLSKLEKIPSVRRACKVN